ncbi:MAG: septum formation protein Maf [Chloroflexi bacterium]|nr:MAG: septum formation protein Maf [Chloroflexota bacterium]
MKPSPLRTPVILASASPRRRQLFALLGIPFIVRAADVDETPLPAEKPHEMASRLARMKAQVVAAEVQGLVVAADTLVVLDSEILGKPADIADAVRILRRLRGRTHRVMTAFTVLRTDSGREQTEVVQSTVEMRPYTEDEIAAYVAGGDPLDKAGAYAIQHGTFMPVARLSGCPANVMGLPVCKIDAVLRAQGLDLGRTSVQLCQPAASFCAIRDRVLPA